MTNLQFANPQITDCNGTTLAARTISIRRNRFLHNGLHERLGFFNYNAHAVSLDVMILIGSDFRDMFDVRGYFRRTEFGRILEPQASDGELVFGYQGLDGTERETVVRFDREPEQVTTTTPDPSIQASLKVDGISGAGDPRVETVIEPSRAEIHFRVEIPPAQYRVITTLVEPRVKETQAIRPRSSGLTLDQEFLLIRDSYAAWSDSTSTITTNNESLNAVILRSMNDLRLLSDQVPDGYLPPLAFPGLVSHLDATA